MANKIDLNAPAFGVGAQKIEEVAEETVVEPAKVAEEPKVEETDTSDEESKVPYSRFKKFHDAAREAEREAAYWRAQAEARVEAPRSTEVAIDPQDEAYKLWLENFGDNEASRKAWQNQLRITQTLEERALARAREEAVEAVRNERYEEAARTEENMDKLDDNFETLSDYLGRKLTDAEQSALLDIVDDYTPKDAEGNYLGELMPFEKAWEVYELKQQVTRSPRAAARNSVAALSGAGTQGEVGAVAERDKNWNPFDWDSYKKRL